MENYRIGLYEKAMPDALPWRDKLLCAKECGYDFVEISIDESDARLARLDWTPEERRELCAIMDDAGMRIRSMCLSAHRKYPLGSPDPAVRAESLTILQYKCFFMIQKQRRGNTRSFIPTAPKPSR